MGDLPGVRNASGVSRASGAITDNEEQMAQNIFARIGYTYDGETKGIASHNGILVLKATKQPEILPAYKRAAIKKIQVILKALGLLAQDFKTDGAYNKDTQNAVKKFQNMIGAVGSTKGDIIGKQTLDALLRAKTVLRGSGNPKPWQGNLIYIATGIELNPLDTQVAGNPPNVEEMLISLINQSSHLKETREGRSTIYYKPEGTSQATKILKAALWVIGLEQRGASVVYTQNILSSLLNSSGGGYGATVGQKALKVISKALLAAHEATKKGLDPYDRGPYIKFQVKGMWDK